MLSVNSCTSALICDNLSSISFGCWYHCCYLSSWELFTYVTKWESALPLVPYLAIIDQSSSAYNNYNNHNKTAGSVSSLLQGSLSCFRMFGDETFTAQIRTPIILHAVRILYMFHNWAILSLTITILQQP